ncbi:MAG: lysophospholipase [Paucimonas sp.]|jgi:pimeloyl-ACP methyl ester carboxylesterase|nr:lysophospholipase [Paucimonas sp.]
MSRRQLAARLFMRVMFGRVQGHAQPLPAGARAFQVQPADGSRLEGLLLPSHVRPPRGVVLLCHPFLKDGMHYFLHHQLPLALQQQGYDVALFNFKGFGRSTLGGPSFADDILAVARQLAAESPGLPLHLLGCSFGGYHLAHALGRGEHGFTSVALDSVPLSVRDFFRRGPLRPVMGWLSRSRWADATGSAPIGEALAQAGDLPLAYLYGESDPYIAAANVQRLLRRCPGLRLYPFAECRHLDGHRRQRQRYIDTLLDFFARAEHRARALHG